MAALLGPSANQGGDLGLAAGQRMAVDHLQPSQERRPSQPGRQAASAPGGGFVTEGGELGEGQRLEGQGVQGLAGAAGRRQVLVGHVIVAQGGCQAAERQVDRPHTARSRTRWR